MRDDAAILAYLDKKPWKLKGSTEQGLVPDGQITRVLEAVSPDLIDGLVQYLREYTDPKNDIASKSVDGLAIQKSERDGVWRCVGVEGVRDPENNENFSLEQTFRKEYNTAASLTDGTGRIEATAYANSNSSTVTGVSNTTSDSPLLSYTIRFANVAPQYVDTIKASLGASTTTNPIVQDRLGLSVTLTGTWNILDVTNRPEDDGGHSILVRIANNLYTLEGYSNTLTPRAAQEWNIWNVPLDLAQTIINDFKTVFTTRASVLKQYNKTDSTVDLVLRYKSVPATHFATANIGVNCRYIETQEVYLAVSDPLDAAYDLPTDPTLTPGYAYEKKWSENGDGTYDVYLITRIRQNQTTTFIEKVTANATSTEVQSLGETASLTPLSYEQGRIKRRRITLNEDCSRDRIDNTETPINQYSISAEASPARTVTTESNTEATSALPTPSPTTGYILRNVNKPTEAGNFSTDQITERPTNQQANSYEASPSRTATTATQTEGAEIAQPSPVAGHIKRVSQRPTEAGNYASSLEDITPTDQTSTTYEVSPSKTQSDVLHTENASPISQPSSTQGQIKRASNTPTEAGNTRTVLSTITPTDQTAQTVQDSAASYSVTDTHTEASTQATGAAASGTIRRISNRPTEAGNYSTSDEIITPKNQTATGYEASPARTVTTATQTEGAALSQPSPTTGHIKRVTNRPTEAGNYATVNEDIIPSNQTATNYEVTAARSTTSSTASETTAASAPSYAQGHIKRTSNRPTEAGNVATEVTDTTVTNQTASSSEADYFKTRQIDTQTEATSPASGTFATGTIRRISNAPTEAGCYRVSDEIETPTARASTVLVTMIDADNKTEVVVDRNQVSGGTLPTTHTDGNPILTVKNAKTEAGLVDVESTTDTPQPFAWSGWQSYTDNDGTSYYASFKNATTTDMSSTVCAAMTADTKNSLSFTRNRYGLYEGSASRSAASWSASFTAGWASYERTYAVSKRQYASIRGSRYVRVVHWTAHLKQTSSHTAAYNFIDTVAAEFGKVEALGGGRYYRAVYLDSYYAESWELDEAGL